jgi:hypothetical protein
MQSTIEGQPSFGYINVDLGPGESVTVQTRQSSPFVGSADYFRPVKTDNNSSND